MPTDASDFGGRVALVTGATSGIGLGVARALAGLSARVVGIGRRESPHEALGAGVTYVRADVADEREVGRVVDGVVSEHQRIDFLVCAASVYPAKAFLDIEPSEWHRVLATNLTGMFLCARATIPHMVARRSGSVVLLSSNIARSGATDGAHYAASKGGILGLARSLALEVARDGIRVNTLSPGLTDTPMPRANLSERTFDERAAAIPLRRAGSVAEMVEACLFLLGPESSYMTGQDLRVTGGAAFR